MYMFSYFKNQIFKNIFCISFSDFIPTSVHKTVVLQKKLKNITSMYTKI